MDLLVLGAVMIGAVVFAGVVLVIVYRAMGTLIDWVIRTFGNEDVVASVRSRRASEAERSREGP
jgi:hypothetical protein